MKNLHTKKTRKVSSFGWLIRQMSINQKSGRKTFRRRFVSGSIFVSPCPPECYFKAKRKYSLISGWYTPKTYLFISFGTAESAFPNGLIPRVLSLPPFYFTSSAVTMLSHVIRSKNSIEDWLNLTCFRTFTVRYWKKTWVKNHLSLFCKRVFDELSSVGVSAVFQF